MASLRVRSFHCPMCSGPATVLERPTADGGTHDLTTWITVSVECEEGCDIGVADVPVVV